MKQYDTLSSDRQEEDTKQGSAWKYGIIAVLLTIVVIGAAFFSSRGSVSGLPAVSSFAGASSEEDGCGREGSLMKGDDSGKVYLVMGGKKCWIPNPTVFVRIFGSSGWRLIRTYEQSCVNRVPTGATFSNNAELVQAVGFAHIFLANNGQYHWICNPATYNRYHFNWRTFRRISVGRFRSAGIQAGSVICNGPYKNSPYYTQQAKIAPTLDWFNRGCASLPKIKNGCLIRSSGPAIYSVMENKKDWIPNPSTFNSLYGVESWTDIETYPNACVAKFPNGPAISNGAFLARPNGYPHIFLVNRGKYRWICDPSTYNQYHYDWHTVHQETLETFQDGPQKAGPVLCNSDYYKNSRYYRELDDISSDRSWYDDLSDADGDHDPPTSYDSA